MRVLGVWAATLALSGVLPAGPALARPAHHATHARACCRVPAGTRVQVELVDTVSTKVQQTGDTFALRLATPLAVGGRMVLPAGTAGVGRVVQSTRGGLGGKAAKLVLSAEYLDTRQGHIPLRGLQMATSGHSRSGEASAVGLTGILFAPLGFIGLAVKGGDAEFPAGLTAHAKIARVAFLPSLGPAPRSVKVAEGAPAPDSADTADAPSIDIPPPPTGQAEVVFFRKRSILSTGQWFKVRENGQALGKLTNGAYFIQVTAPGQHTYTATFEPEMKDHLTLDIDAGQTYFVEGGTSKALIVGAADLSPSDRATFDGASRHLKPAPPIGDDKDDDQAKSAQTPPQSPQK